MSSEIIRGAFMRVMSEEKLQKLAEFIKQYVLFRWRNSLDNLVDEQIALVEHGVSN